MLIDQPTERLEQTRQALHLVKDDELAGIAGQQGPWLAQQGEVFRVLKVETDGIATGGNAMGQGGFPHLPRPEETHRRLFRQGEFDGSLQPARNVFHSKAGSIVPDLQGSTLHRQPSRVLLSRRIATVGIDDMARVKVGCCGTEEQQGAGQVFRFTEPAQRSD